MTGGESWRVLRMRELVMNWLDGRPTDSTSLADWLIGEGLPAVGDGAEPYLWILRGLPLGGFRYSYEARLAASLAALLDQAPENAEDSDGRRRVYNMLMLAAGLSCPDELHAPLERMLIRNALRGEWLGVELTAVLRTAISENQIDSTMFPIWAEMLDEKPHPVLGGSPFDGFTGVTLMPASELDRGNPNHFALSEAIVRLAAHLQSRPDAERELRFMLTRTLMYPDRSAWSAVLMLTMARADMPPWAAATVASLLPDHQTADPGAVRRIFLRICRLAPNAWPLYVGTLYKLCGDDPSLDETAIQLVEIVSLHAIIAGLSSIPVTHWQDAARMLKRVMRVSFVPGNKARFETPENLAEISSFQSQVLVESGLDVALYTGSDDLTEYRLYSLAWQQNTSIHDTAHTLQAIAAAME